MITAWVFYHDRIDNSHHWREINAESFTETDPKHWGLPDTCEVLLVLQQGSFLGAWVKGDKRK